MAEQAIKDKTAIVGIGWTAFTRHSGSTALDLALEASIKAAEDAGLSPKQIDGIVTHFHKHMDTAAPREMVRGLGMEKCNFEVFNSVGGSWNCSAVMTAASIVHAGICNYVLVYRALNRYSEGRATRVRRAEEVSGEDQWRTPFGNHHAAATFGHVGTAFMAKYSITSLDFAHLAVTERQHALLNTKAMMRPKGPITIEDHQNSRWIVYPFRLLDCCQETDGAVAMIVTSAERARDLKHPPVYIMAGVGGSGPTEGPWQTNAANAAPLLYEGAGITPKEVSLAEIYDPFTAMCLAHIQDYSLVEKGDVGAWVREGHNKLDGTCPVNTHGGLLSEAHIHGQNHVIEAVQQLRPEGVVDDLCQGPHTYDRRVCRQVRDPEIALVCGEAGGSSMLLRRR